MIEITLPDGNQKKVEQGVTPVDIAKDIHPALAKDVLAARVNGEVVDANRPLYSDANLELLKWDDQGGKMAFWHSSAHLMAEALEELYPGVKFGIGPPIENGFYYDVDLGGRELTPEELPEIEKKMKEHAEKKEVFERQKVSKEEAKKFFKEKGDEYKLELIEELDDADISFYKQGDFIDLCRGPHIQHTGYIKAVKLTNIAGAYWRGDENNKMLTRIYGITFPKQKELDEYLEQLEEAKKRDHRKLGKELELFTFSDKVGPGLPMWTPKGAIVRETLQAFMRKEQEKRGYKPVITPHIAKKDLYITSGHYEKYGEDSYRPIQTPHEGEEYMLKPMNCPHHCEIYKDQMHSYRDLPYRMFEFGTVYRYEQSGELNGLVRARGFTQDDAHIFCTPDQLKAEFTNVIDLIMVVFERLGFGGFTAQVSLRDPNDRENYIGSDENWEKAENAIMEAAEEKDLSTVTEYGEAAFYGPKLDFMVRDALNRSWQLGTIQVDYNLPERFDLEYVGEDNEKHRPVMIHRAPFGSMERFIGVLLEHCEGNLPVWLAPEQVAILPINDKVIDFAQNVLSSLQKQEIRGVIDTRDEKISRKIRDAETKKIPYMLIVGENEKERGEVSVRRHTEGDLGSQKVETFQENIREEITQ